MLKYIEFELTFYFSPHSLRIKYEPSEGSMMIDLSTIHSLELIQNLQHAKSKDCLFGILNQTLTPMGARLLKSNLLQPLMEKEQLEDRYDAVGELSRKEDVFFAVRQGIFISIYALQPLNPAYQSSPHSFRRCRQGFDSGKQFRVLDRNKLMSADYRYSHQAFHELLGTVNQQRNYAETIRKFYTACSRRIGGYRKYFITRDS